MAAKTKRNYGIALFAAIVSGLLIVGATVLLVVDARSAWLFRHAPACAGTITSGCRDRAAARLLDVQPVKRGRDGKIYQLVMADGARLDVDVLPARWRAIPPGGLPATLERLDGRVFTVSAAGVTVPTDDSPGAQLPLIVPCLAVFAGLLWYCLRFIAAERAIGSGRAARTPRPWARWPRRGAVVIAGGACATFLVEVIEQGVLERQPSLPEMLVIWAAAAAVIAAVMAASAVTARRRLRRRLLPR